MLDNLDFFEPLDTDKDEYYIVARKDWVNIPADCVVVASSVVSCPDVVWSAVDIWDVDSDVITLTVVSSVGVDSDVITLTVVSSVMVDSDVITFTVVVFSGVVGA